MTTAQTQLNFNVKAMVTGPDFLILYHCEIGQKKFVSMVTYEFLLLADDILDEHVPRQPHETY